MNENEARERAIALQVKINAIKGEARRLAEDLRQALTKTDGTGMTRAESPTLYGLWDDVSWSSAKIDDAAHVLLSVDKN